jgi:hypothetical protein
MIIIMAGICLCHTVLYVTTTHKSPAGHFSFASGEKGLEIWSLTLREEHRLRVFENRVLRIFGPKREEDGSWRKLHNDELHNLYSSLNIVRVIKSRMMGWAGHVARMGDGMGGKRCLQGFGWEARRQETTGKT